MTKNVKCIVCPIGCDIIVQGKEGVVTDISGNECKRGETYARDEFLCPKRLLSTVIKAEGYRLHVVSVRTDAPIPKDRLFDCMEHLRGLTARAPFKVGQVVVENILDTGANIIITKK